MGKRSNKTRVEKDFYPTPKHAIDALLPHLHLGVKFVEPCAGDGALVDHLEEAGAKCVHAFDVEPRHHNVEEGDALNIYSCQGEMFITNPPYTWSILNELIPALTAHAKAWLLLPADMMHNKRMAPHMDRCAKVVSVGRVKWFGSGGMENSAWYLFMPIYHKTIFYGRLKDA